MILRDDALLESSSGGKKGVNTRRYESASPIIGVEKQLDHPEGKDAEKVLCAKVVLGKIRKKKRKQLVSPSKK